MTKLKSKKYLYMQQCKPDKLSLPVTISEKESSSGFVSPLLFGSNLEHTRSDIYYGLSAQLLRNRKFAGKPECYHGCMAKWYPIGEKVFFSEDKPYTGHGKNYAYAMKREHECHAEAIVNFESGVPAGIGQHEIALFKEKEYEFRAVLKSNANINLTVALTGRFGNQVYAKQIIEVNASEEWETVICILSPHTTDEDADIRISFTEQAAISLGAVSLMQTDNFRGMRIDVIEKMKEIGISILRWPGGNFAGEYCWEDGLLPVDMRAPIESHLYLETQPHSMCYDFHEINIDDFIMLCRKIGAEPYITINPIWNSPKENARMVEYCNGDINTEYGKIRAERGFSEPFNVKYWSLGNEMGYRHMEGTKSALGYSCIARANAKAMLAVDKKLMLCTSGPYPNRKWAICSSIILGKKVAFNSLHHYAPSPTFRAKDGMKNEYYKLIEHLSKINTKLHRLAFSLPKSRGISFDEWNIWYAWYHQSSIYNGIFAAIMFHLIMQNAQECRLKLCCHFEAINEGMIEVTPKSSKLTAEGQMASVMKKHKSGELIHSSLFSTVTKHENTFEATFINASFDEDKSFDFPKYGKVSKATLWLGEKMEPCTYFKKTAVDLTETDKRYSFVVPPHSVLAVTLEK